ncbi:TPA: phage tail tape measure protein [Clostridioides difficile]|uniref:phage tail tape measure protein n=3 Tax=Clostridioides difficile TaxID=1496 RepID=UPI0003B1857B|nr:phage tail tape measure protein [Clostridioides difficile]ERM40778.1 phage tail tape measure protein, TP901 family, core region [Clostridioides difficile P64]EGT4571165.1 phage tail tape measure protein [Clostridioides difficile]EGT4861518.1 phage tail tape measure protein [Clostridioides difficile]EKG0833480.1 phage tail tape measure protein [Clostridioides difficile]MBF9851672.1 phage tail tape measure protein [Clostridioides difficile]
MREIAKKEMYHIDVVISAKGDGETKSKLSAMEKYMKQTEKRMQTLNRIKVNPAIKATDKASSVVNRVNNNMNKAKKTVTARIKATDNASPVANRASNNVNKAKKTVTARLKATDNASSTVNKVNNKIKEVAKPIPPVIIRGQDESSSIIDKVKAKIQNLKADTIIKIKSQADEAINTISRTKNKLQEFVSKRYEAAVKIRDEASSALGGLTGKIDSFVSGAISKFARLATTAGALIGGIGVGSAVKGFATFEQSMKNTQAVSGATGKEMEALTAKARQLGRETSFTAKDAGDAMYYMGMAGWKSEQMIKAIPDVLNLAAAGGTDLALTSDIVTDGLTALGMTANDTTEFVDVMAATITNSNTSVELMGETFKYIGSVGGALGVSMKDLSLATGLMASASVKGSMAGTSLRGGLVRLIKPPEEAASAIKKYGIELKKNKNGSLDLAGTIGSLREKLGGLEKVEKGAAIQSIFGRTAMAGWAAVVNASESDFNKLTTAIAESEGEAKRIADMKLDTLSGQFEILKSAIDDVRISVGQRLGPMTRGFVEDLIKKMPQIGDAIVQVAEKFVNNFDKIKAGFQVLLPGIGAVIGAVTLLKVAFAFGSAIRSLKILKAALGATSISAMLLPVAIGAIVIAFAGMSVAISNNKVAIMSLQEKFGVFGDFVTGLMERVGGTIKLIGGNLLIIISSIGQAIGILLSNKSWGEKASSLKNLFGKTMAEIKTNTKEALSDIAGETSNATAMLKTASQEELQGVTKAFSTAFEQSKNVTERKSSEIAKALSSSLDGMGESSLTMMRGLNDDMAIILSGVSANMKPSDKVNKITKNLDDAFKAGKLNAEDYRNSIQETMNFINKYGAGSSNRIKQGMSNAFNAFKDGTNIGGLKDGVTGMLNSLKSTGPQALETLKSLGGKASEIFKGVDFNSSIDTQKTKVLENLNSLGLEGTQAIDTLRTVFSQASTALDTTNLKQGLSNTFNSFKEGFNSGGIKNAINSMLGTINQAGPQMQEALGKMDGKMGQVFANVDFSTTIETQSSKVLENLNNLGIEGPKVLEAVRNIFAQASSQIQGSASQTAQQANQQVVDALTQGNPAVQQAGQQLGADLTNGVVNGVQAGVPVVQQKSNELATATQNGVTNAVNSATPQIDNSNLTSGIDTAFNQATATVQQGASSMYNGAKQSFTQLAQIGREAGSSLYNGATTSFNMLATNVRVACSSMYNGARTSFTSLSSSAISAISAMCSSVVSQVSAMSSQVISYWNSVRATVSAPISASFNVKTTQTTVKRTVNEGGGILSNIFGHFAEGGVASKPSICGEDGAEMVIPLSNNRRNRAIGLYEQTGKMLGLSSTPSQKIGESYSNVVNNVRQFPLTNVLDTDNKEYREATPNSVNSSNSTINLGGISINVQESNNKEEMIQEILSQVESGIREALQDIG